MSAKTRRESDSIGEMMIPTNAYYGVQSLRGAENFKITGVPLNPEFINNMARIKKAAAIVNCRAGLIKNEVADAVIKACDEIISGKLHDEFIVDAVQGGAGTSANMNANEVIANRAIELLGGTKGDYSLVHPNDTVNRCQSTNDVIPTAGKMTVINLTAKLVSALKDLEAAFNIKAAEFDGIVKMGRTQLQDAVPIRLGQEFAAYASAVRRSRERIADAEKEMHVVNIGGTAIGTCVNASDEYLKNIVPELSCVAGYELKRADDLIDATQHVDCFVAFSSALKTAAVALSKIANDLRLMSSGPKTGIEEIVLPAMQNGSSIMPGKINPVIPEVVNQTAFLVIGHDATITAAAEAGQLELNAFEPVIFYHVFESVSALTGAVITLTENCVKGIRANAGKCADNVASSAGIITAAVPYIGYRRAAEIAKESLKTGASVRDILLREGGMDAETVDCVLDAASMTVAPDNLKYNI